MSGRFEATGIRKMMPGKSTVPLASGITGRVTTWPEAIFAASQCRKPCRVERDECSSHETLDIRKMH